MIYWGFGALAFIVVRMSLGIYEVTKRSKK